MRKAGSTRGRVAVQALLVFAFWKSKLPSASTSVSDFFCQMHSICAAFSSSVIRESRSFTRLA